MKTLFSSALESGPIAGATKIERHGAGSAKTGGGGSELLQITSKVHLLCPWDAAL